MEEACVVEPRRHRPVRPRVVLARREGYRAVMVTDTVVFRDPHYHAPTDTSDKLDFDRMARVVRGLEKAVAERVDAK